MRESREERVVVSGLDNKGNTRDPRRRDVGIDAGRGSRGVVVEGEEDEFASREEGDETAMRVCRGRLV